MTQVGSQKNRPAEMAGRFACSGWRWGESNPRPERSTEDILQAYSVIFSTAEPGTDTLLSSGLLDNLEWPYPTLRTTASRSVVA